MRTRRLPRLLAGIVATAMIVVTAPSLLAAAAGGPNLAIGKAASASSSNAPYGAGNLNDGNQGSYWEGSNGAFSQWAQVDLGATASIDTSR